jgi:hypothetical protein
MFRFFCVVNGRRLESHPCGSLAVCERFLAAALGCGGVEGGAVEELTPGIGWTVFIPTVDRELLEIC